MNQPQERRRALIASLRQRFLLAEASGDAQIKQALFQEAAALNLPPDLWHGQESGPEARPEEPEAEPVEPINGDPD